MKKTVFITGVCGGIGAALAASFKKEGWVVFGNDIIEKKDNRCDYFFMGDISTREVVEKIKDKIIIKKLSLTSIINNAAISIGKSILDIKEEEWDKIIGVNLKSIYLTTKYFIPIMKHGSLINISSVHARATVTGLSPYAASKGAISALTRSLALELGEYNIRVNAILPGAILTPMLKKDIKRKNNPEAALKSLILSSPLKRIGTPQDVAHLALFLSDSVKAANITGQEFVCDSGVLAKLPSE